MQHMALIVALLVEGSRDKRGSDWCRKYGIGFARRRLGPTQPRLMIPGPEASESLAMRQAAANELRDMCRACGACRMANE